MKPSGRLITSYTFGSFALRLRPAELQKNGKPIKLAPQPLQALALLLENAGQVVTREEIQKLIWADGTVVDFELGLNRCIRRVRSALLDDADAPRYLETIPRVGYRFIAPVQPRLEDKLPPDVPALAVLDLQTPPNARRIPKPKWIALALAALAAIGILVAFLLAGRHGVRQADFTPEPLTSDLGLASTPSFSPDGQQIAFAWNGEDQNNFDIYIKMVGSPAVVRLTHDTQVDFSPAWSPDGTLIAFCRGSIDQGSAIWVTSPLGGQERKVIDLAAPAIPGYRALTWGADGRSFIYSDSLPAQDSAAIFRADLQGGKKRQLTFPPQSAADLHPAMAPDGHAIAFVRDTGRGVSAIYTLAIGKDGSPAGAPRQLSWPGFGSSLNARPKWTPDSRDLVFTSNRTGERQLWTVKLDGGAKPRLLASVGSAIEDSAISKNGKLALVRGVSSINIWRLDLSRLRQTLPIFPVRILASTRIQTNPSVSPDGKRVAFESNRSGFTEIWTSNADGTNVAPLTALQNPITGSPAWAHDGARIAFDARTTGLPGIYVIPSGGGRPVLITENRSRDVVPSWSTDDAWIYFTSDRSGTSEIWKIPSSPTSAARPLQLTHNGGFAACPSPDGRFLYYSANRNVPTTLRRLDLKTGEESTIASGILPRKYGPTNDGVYYMQRTVNPPQALMFYDSRSQRSELIAKFDRPIDQGFSLSADGAQLYYGQVDDDTADLMLVDNFWR